MGVFRSSALIMIVELLYIYMSTAADLTSRLYTALECFTIDENQATAFPPTRDDELK